MWRAWETAPRPMRRLSGLPGCRPAQHPWGEGTLDSPALLAGKDKGYGALRAEPAGWLSLKGHHVGEGGDRSDPLL